MGIDELEFNETPNKLLVSRVTSLQGRAFLNSVDSEHTGSMKYEMTIRKRKRSKNDKEKGHYYTLWGNIQLRDCSRQINLTLDGGTKNAQSLKELDNAELKLLKIKKLCEMQLEAIKLIKDGK